VLILVLLLLSDLVTIVPEHFIYGFWFLRLLPRLLRLLRFLLRLVAARAQERCAAHLTSAAPGVPVSEMRPADYIHPHKLHCNFLRRTCTPDDESGFSFRSSFNVPLVFAFAFEPIGRCFILRAEQISVCV
jgi:hypothetical protein